MAADRIEKTIVLRAPRSRVWRAIANPEEFGAWFRVKFDGAVFAPGAHVFGHVTYPGYEHYRFEATIERMDPEWLFSYRWHPSPEPGTDPNEPTTLVEFRLDEVASGTQLTVIESGFERIPLPRREAAFRMNEGGWAEQMKNIERHVSA